MNKNQFRKLIREELKSSLSEGAIENKVADLYAYSGIKTTYSSDMIERYGKAAVDAAIAMAPKMIAYKQKLKDIVKEIGTTPEGKMLMNIAKQSKGYSGDHGPVNVGDIFNNLR